VEGGHEALAHLLDFKNMLPFMVLGAFKAVFVLLGSLSQGKYFFASPGKFL
jgi:hypothetical protein